MARIYIALAVMATIGLLPVYSCGKSELKPEKMMKSFDKLNEHIDKSDCSESPEEMMLEIESYLDEKSSKCGLFCDKALLGTMKKLIALADISSTSGKNYECDPRAGRELMETIDSGLDDPSRREKMANYRMTHMDELVEYYAFKAIRACVVWDREWPQMDFGLKQLVYDQINDYLLAQLPRTYDVEANMNKVEELLDSSVSRDRSLDRGLRQFLELRKVLEGDSCNRWGHRVLLKNDLATRGHGHKWYSKYLRRVDRIFLHYAIKHEELCRDKLQKALGPALAQLDKYTYRRVLALASSIYVMDYRSIVNNANKKEVSEDFTLPTVADFVRDPMRRSLFLSKLDRSIELDANELRHFIRELMLNEPYGDYATIMDDNKRNVPVDHEELEPVLRKYLYVPCGNFMAAVGGQVEADEYGRNFNDIHLMNQPRELQENLSYYMTHIAYRTCKQVLRSQKKLEAEMASWTRRTW